MPASAGMTRGGVLVLGNCYYYLVVRTPPSPKRDDGAFFQSVAVGGFVYGWLEDPSPCPLPFKGRGFQRVDFGRLLLLGRVVFRSARGWRGGPLGRIFFLFLHLRVIYRFLPWRGGGLFFC